MNIYSAFVKYLKNGDKRRFLSPCSSHHLSESEPQFHCPTLESVHVSTVAGSILTCYKCFNDARSYCTFCTMVPGDASYHRMRKNVCHPVGLCCLLQSGRFCVFFGFVLCMCASVFLHPHTNTCSQLMDLLETGMIIMALGATLRL